MSPVISAQEVYAVLVHLADNLHTRDPKLAERLTFASRFATGSTSELFGEASRALQFVLDTGTDLHQPEKDEARNTIRRIRAEFERVGQRPS
jgi:hypothetical protein